MIRKFLQLIFILAITTTSSAETETRYRFEIIIFEYNNPSYSQTELWSDNPGTPDYAQTFYTIYNSAPKSSPSAINSRQFPGVEFQPLDRSSLILAKEARAVRKASERRQLLHTAWVQTMHDEKKAVPIAIKTGKLYNTLEKEPVSKSVRFTEQGEVANTDSFRGALPLTETSATMIPVKQHQLEGTIKITIGRYLHVWTDLVYRQPVATGNYSAETNSYDNVRSYRYQDHRRMRSKELHYIDNPNFGILIYALPVE
jgi:hypothetical protein